MFYSQINLYSEIIILTNFDLKFTLKLNNLFLKLDQLVLKNNMRQKR